MKCPFDDKIDLTDWGFDIADELDAIIAKCAAQAINNTLKETPPLLSSPFYWKTCDGYGAAPVSDPLMLYLNFPFRDGDGVNVKISLKAYFAEMRKELDGSWSDYDAELNQRMAEALRKQADLFAKNGGQHEQATDTQGQAQGAPGKGQNDNRANRDTA